MKRKVKRKVKVKVKESSQRIAFWRGWCSEGRVGCEGAGGCGGELKVNVKGKVCGWRFGRVMSGMEALDSVGLGVTRCGSRGGAGPVRVELLEDTRREALAVSKGLGPVGG
jgi:hypothetical protein